MSQHNSDCHRIKKDAFSFANRICLLIRALLIRSILIVPNKTISNKKIQMSKIQFIEYNIIKSLSSILMKYVIARFVLFIKISQK